MTSDQNMSKVRCLAEGISRVLAPCCIFIHKDVMLEQPETEEYDVYEQVDDYIIACAAEAMLESNRQCKRLQRIAEHTNFKSAKSYKKLVDWFYESNALYLVSLFGRKFMANFYAMELAHRTGFSCVAKRVTIKHNGKKKWNYAVYVK